MIVANGKDDIRLHVGWVKHHKTIRLRRMLAADGPMSLLALWCYAAQHKPTGDLSGMPVDEIEAAADWSGTPGAFHAALIACRWLEADGMLHDWIEEQPWASNRDERIASARRNGRLGGLAKANRQAKHSEPLSDPVTEVVSGFLPPLLSSPTPKETESTTVAEPPAVPVSDPLLQRIRSFGIAAWDRDRKLTGGWAETQRRAFPALDLDREVSKAASWWSSNPARTRSKSAIGRFLASWFARAAELGGSPSMFGAVGHGPPAPSEGVAYVPPILKGMAR